MIDSFRIGWSILACLLAVMTGKLYAQGKLADPIPVIVGGKALDVEHSGGAAPSLLDIDRDGVNDLLVGENFNGRMRIYRNVGTPEDPRFSDYSLFKDGLPEGCVPSNYGFCPHIADLDEDGLVDILTPAWHGKLIWFRQESPGVFSSGVSIVNTLGKVIKTEWTHGASTCDWDDDGHLDIVFSVSDQAKVSNVFLLRNAAVANGLRFQDPVSVIAGGKPLYVNTSAPEPLAVDWDGDQLFDLVIGTSEGSVVIYRNQGRIGMPVFLDAVELIAKPVVGSERGRNAHVYVTDWNGDGRLDILLGDTGERFQRDLSAVEKKTKLEAQTSQQDAFARWARVYRSYRQLKPREVENGSNVALVAARKELIRLTKEEDLHHLAYDDIQEGQQSHGRVWLFLGKD